MKTVVVRKRYGNEALDVRELVRPQTYMCAQASKRLWKRAQSKQDYLMKCFEFVTHDITYPQGHHNHLDWHEMHAYRHQNGQTAIHYSVNDFWNYPSETLRDMMGDCDDKSILLVSLLRRLLGPQMIYCTVGTLDGIGHMWVSLKQNGTWLVLETTYKTAKPLYPEVDQSPLHYKPFFRFNDKEVILIPGWRVPQMHRPG